MILEKFIISILENLDTISWITIILSAVIVIPMMIHDYIKKHKKRKIMFLKKGSPEKSHGIIFGRKGNKVVFSPTRDEGSVGVFSSTGTGKTSAIGIPTLRQWSGTSFIIDISGDINNNCPNIENKLIYEPEDPDTTKYNIFGSIDDLDCDEEKTEALSELVHLIVPDDPSITGAGKFFYEGGREILLAAFISFYFAGKDFIDICKLINDCGWKDLFNSIDNTGCEPGISHLSGFDPDRASDNAGCMQDAKKAISFFATNHKVIRSVGRPSDGESCVVSKKIETNSIVIIIEDEKLELYSPLLNIIVSQQMQYISSRKVTPSSKQILLFLDEYASLRIDKEIILAALRKYRKKLCRIMICTQSIADLNLLYGDDATKAILSNLKFKVLLGGLNEPESQKYFSELIGYKYKKRHSTSQNAHNVTSTISDSREYVIEPADLDRLGSDTVLLLFPSNSGYLKLKKNYYFK